MRILQVGKYYPPYKGGIENNTRHCSEELSKDHEVIVLVFNTNSQTVEEEVNGIKVIRVGSMGNLFSQELTFKMIKYIKGLKPDIIHFHAPNPVGMVSILIGAPKSAKIVVTHHTDIVRQKFLKKIVLPLYKILLKRTARIISYTDKYPAHSDELVGFEDKFSTVPNGTSEKPFMDELLIAKVAADFRDKYTKGAPTVAFLGRQVAYKGIDLIIKAIARTTDVHALIGGHGPELKNNKQLAHDLGIADRVHFVGEINDFNKGGFLHASDIFLLPCTNRTESYGQVLVEAQLCKLPTIVSDVGSGVSEVTQHNETGLVIPPNNVDALHTAIVKLINDPELRTRMGDAGYIRAKTNYVETVTGPLLRKLFNDLA
ncbi:hypothetical protein DJ568_01920 [Mucilaginibacter hurinus]|uniref:Glycosyltransferase n=1 Tax=Mucilaginibacter hurinus TaxID=2201324 RepID=A0A367GV30_9SPHI|nr:glycosyltransferase [Mucilaginibacter hurinus]RCH56641.1 hypothetical protein DJ568_01920 [Mucilaginibacter hurinus]